MKQRHLSWNSYLKTVSVLSLAMVLSGCVSSGPERDSTKRLTKVVQNQGYSLFQPFRTDDYPASIFVFTKDHRGNKTDFLLGYWKNSFNAEVDELFKRQDVKTENKIVGAKSLDAEIAASFIEPIISGAISGKSVRSSTISFGDKQEVARMSLATLSELRDRFNDNTLAALRFYKSRGQLSSCYILMEVLIVNDFRMELTLDNQASASVAVEKVKQLGEAKLRASLTSSGNVLIEATGPYMVGFKALKVEDSVLSSAVPKPPIPDAFLSPEEVSLIRK